MLVSRDYKMVLSCSRIGRRRGEEEEEGVDSPGRCFRGRPSSCFRIVLQSVYTMQKSLRFRGRIF